MDQQVKPVRGRWSRGLGLELAALGGGTLLACSLGLSPLTALLQLEILPVGSLGMGGMSPPPTLLPPHSKTGWIVAQPRGPLHQ